MIGVAAIDFPREVRRARAGREGEVGRVGRRRAAAFAGGAGLEAENAAAGVGSMSAISSTERSALRIADVLDQPSHAGCARLERPHSSGLHFADQSPTSRPIRTAGYISPSTASSMAMLWPTG